MFGNSPGKDDDTSHPVSPAPGDGSKPTNTPNDLNPDEKKRTGNNAGTGPGVERKPSDSSPSGEKKRRSSGVSRARDMFSSAKQSLHLTGSAPTAGVATAEKPTTTPMQRLAKADPALSVPQGSLNNSAGESHPGPRSTFRVGVTEDKNKKCRRTMEDTHAYLYNFLSTPAPSYASDKARTSVSNGPGSADQAVVETDNGYFAIFDGHAGTFAADWCGKKLHLLLEDKIREEPNSSIPELINLTFGQVDDELAKLPHCNIHEGLSKLPRVFW